VGYGEAAAGCADAVGRAAERVASFLRGFAGAADAERVSLQALSDLTQEAVAGPLVARARGAGGAAAAAEAVCTAAALAGCALTLSHRVTAAAASVLPVDGLDADSLRAASLEARSCVRARAAAAAADGPRAADRPTGIAWVDGVVPRVAAAAAEALSESARALARAAVADPAFWSPELARERERPTEEATAALRAPLLALLASVGEQRGLVEEAARGGVLGWGDAAGALRHVDGLAGACLAAVGREVLTVWGMEGPPAGRVTVGGARGVLSLCAAALGACGGWSDRNATPPALRVAVELAGALAGGDLSALAGEGFVAAGQGERLLALAAGALGKWREAGAGASWWSRGAAREGAAQEGAARRDADAAAAALRAAAAERK